MMFNWKTMFVGLLLVSLIVAGRLANHYRNNAITYKYQRDTATHNLKLANETITDMTKRQRDVAALDAKYTKELADAQNRNTDLLRIDLDAVAQLGRFENVEAFVADTDVVEDLNDLTGKPALRELRRALHEQHDVVRLHFVVDELLDAHFRFLA